MYFLNEDVLYVNNKNKPCLLTRIIDFLSPKVAALLFVNWQIGAFAFAKISCSDKLAATSVQQYISLVFRLCYPKRFICICIYLKPNEETNALERKAILNFVLERLRLVPRLAQSYEEPPRFYIRSSCSIKESTDFSIVLQGK